MVSTVYRRCLEILQICKDNQYFKEVPLEELKQIIAQHIGGDPRTMVLYLSRMQYFGLMKLLNPHVMQIQPIRIDVQAVRKRQEVLDDAILSRWGIRSENK